MRSNEAIEAQPKRSRPTAGKLLRWVLPFAVSGAFFAYILGRVDVAAAFARMTPQVALYYLPPLVGIELARYICLLRR